MRTKLTPAFCQKATAQQGAERTIYWDVDMPGFGLGGHEERAPFIRRAVPRRRDETQPPDEDCRRARPHRRPQTSKEAARARLPTTGTHCRSAGAARKAIARTEDTFQKIAENYLAREGQEPADARPAARDAKAARLSRGSAPARSTTFAAATS